jgi:hypothetical protein
MEWDDILAEAIWSESYLYKGDQEAPFGVSSFQFYSSSFLMFYLFILSASLLISSGALACLPTCQCM